LKPAACRKLVSIDVEGDGNLSPKEAIASLADPKIKG